MIISSIFSFFTNKKRPSEDQHAIILPLAALQGADYDHFKILKAFKEKGINPSLEQMSQIQNFYETHAKIKNIPPEEIADTIKKIMGVKLANDEIISCLKAGYQPTVNQTTEHNVAGLISRAPDINIEVIASTNSTDAHK